MRWLSLLCVFLWAGCDAAPAPASPPPAAADDDGLRTLGGLRARVIGDGTGPVIILLHGWGAPGDDLVGLAERLDVPAGARFVVPEAHLERPGGGRMWWPLDPDRLRDGQDRDLSDETPPGMAEARAKTIALVRDVRRTMRVPLSRIVLAGFSQGAMLALDVALHLDGNVAGVAVLSGTLVSEDAWIPRMRERRGLPVLVAHGRSDAILPFRMAEALRDALQEHGADVRWIPNDGGHTIPREVTRALEQFVAETT